MITLVATPDQPPAMKTSQPNTTKGRAPTNATVSLFPVRWACSNGLTSESSSYCLQLHIIATGLFGWADVRVVLTKSALHFVKKEDLPSGVPVYTDEDEWSTWSRIGDEWVPERRQNIFSHFFMF